MNCKKVLILTSEFPPQPGGIGNHAYNLALELHELGFMITVLTDERSANGIEEQIFDTSLAFHVVRIKRYSFIGMTYLRRVFIYLKLMNKKTKVIASGKFSLWLVGLVLVFPKKHKYAIIHGSEVNLQGISKNVTNASLQKFHKIIAVSNYTRSLIQQLRMKNITVIPNGFRIPSKLNQLILDKDEKKKYFPALITVGNVTERKGQLNVIKSLPELIKIYPTIHYHMVGIPTEQIVYETIARDLGVEKYVTFHGKVSEALKFELLQQSDIFVMLSNVTTYGDVEGFGIAIIEANALGLPAIGANTSGIVDAIKDNYSGKLIDPLNVNSLVKATEEVLVKYETYSSNSKQWSTNFSWHKIIKQYIDVIG